MSANLAAAPARGLFDALRSMGGTLAEIVRVRGALFAVELGEEVERRKQMMVLLVAGAALLHLGVLLLTLFVAIAFWDTHRLAAVGAMAVTYLACGAVAFVMLRARLAASPTPFAATLGELDRDLAQMRPLP